MTAGIRPEWDWRKHLGAFAQERRGDGVASAGDGPRRLRRRKIWRTDAVGQNGCGQAAAPDHGLMRASSSASFAAATSVSWAACARNQ